MPRDLDKSYASILCRIPEAERKLAREAMIWLSFTERPLDISELCEAVVVRESDTTLDSDSRLPAPDAIIEICQGLAQCDNSLVILAHSSIRNFLVSQWIRSSPAKFFSVEPAAARKTLMRKCLTYLCFQDFQSGYRESPSDYYNRLINFPFFQYAAKNLPIYARSCKLDAEDYHLIAKLFDTKKLPGGGNFSSWIQCLHPHLSSKQVEAREPLYYAASFGLLPLVRSILTTQPDINIDARGGRFDSTPLFVALWHGNLQVVELLLKHGADPRPVDSSTGFTPLSFARERGLSKTAELLERYLSRYGS
jgi:Ankyrin repeats (3 copies)